MSKRSSDYLKEEPNELKDVPSLVGEGDVENSVGSDPNRKIRLRFVRLLRRGPSAWRCIGALMEHRGQDYTNDIFKADQMTIAQMVSEATDQNGVGLPLMTLVSSNVLFEGVDIVAPCKHVFTRRSDYDEGRSQALSVDPEELESARTELRWTLKERATEKLTKSLKEEDIDKETARQVQTKINNATHQTRRRLEPLINAGLIKEVTLEDGEKVAYQSTALLREALDSMMTGIWAFDTEEE